MKKKQLKKLLKIELSRRSFYEYCRTLYPSFYKKNRLYLKYVCDTLQSFIEDKEKKVLMLSMPSQHGKSFSVCNLVSWLLGRYKDFRIMTGSYNELLSTKFSKDVRDTIQKDTSNQDDVLLYKDIFNTKIERGYAAAKMWKTNKSAVINYLATSPNGSATGFGADLLIIDDLIKSGYEANNELILEKQWAWFSQTMLSRLIGQKSKLILIGTRWSEEDLIGRYKRLCESENIPYVEINIPIINEEGNMLCEEILSKKDFENKRKIMCVNDEGRAIFEANYFQTPIDVKNRLYSDFKLYDPKLIRENNTEKNTEEDNLSLHFGEVINLNEEEIKEKERELNEEEIVFDRIFSYTDTADEGNDYLCSLFFGVYKRELYLLDVIYTKGKMEITEPLVATTINKLKSIENIIESNNGGKGFARNVLKILQKTLNNHYCNVKWFFQGDNKIARIASNSATVCRVVHMPLDWATRWPEFCRDIKRFNTEGKMHDDAPDALTGGVEYALAKKYID